MTQGRAVVVEAGNITINNAAGEGTYVRPGTGATWAATQSGVWTVATTQSGVWTVSATQSGTWTVGVSNGSGGSAVNVQDGGNTLTVDGTVTAQDGGGSLTVDGTFWQATQPVSIAAGSGAFQFVNESGVAYGVKHIQNKPRVSSMPYLYDIAEGNVTAHTHWERFGVNADVDNTRETVWDVGGLYTFPVAAQQMEVISSNVADDGAPGGTGVQTVKIDYLDGSYVAKSETVTLDGTTAVATTATDIFRIVSFRAATVGANGIAAGNIDLRHLTDSPIYARIATGNTRSRSAIYTVAAGAKLYITSIAVSSLSKTASYTVFTLHANYDHVSDTALTFFMPVFEIGAEDSTVVREMEIPIYMPAQTSFYMNAVADANVSNVYAICAMRGWVE